MRLAALLLLLVAATHYAYDPIALALGDVRPAAMFYVLRGVEGFVLFVLLALRVRLDLPALLACAWGAAEELQTSSCRVSMGLASAPRVLPFEGLCGWPAYSIGVAAMACIAVYVAKGGRHG